MGRDGQFFPMVNNLYFAMQRADPSTYDSLV